MHEVLSSVIYENFLPLLYFFDTLDDNYVSSVAQMPYIQYVINIVALKQYDAQMQYVINIAALKQYDA